MGIFSDLFEPKDFDGKVKKLFKHYKYGTRAVSAGMFKDDWIQLRMAILIIAETLCIDATILSYDEIQKYSEIFFRIASRYQMAYFLNSTTLIPNMPQRIYSDFPFLGSENNAKIISDRLMDIL